MVADKRIDIQDAPPDGEISDVFHEIFPFKAHVGQFLHQGSERGLFADFDLDAPLIEYTGCRHAGC